jgi:hypothetical protein
MVRPLFTISTKYGVGQLLGCPQLYHERALYGIKNGTAKLYGEKAKCGKLLLLNKLVEPNQFERQPCKDEAQA